jgi:hypothetical protein
MSCKKTDLCAALALIALLALAAGCQPETRRDLPDVSHIEVEAPIQRFEQDLFRLDTSDMEASLARLQEAYPELSRIFFSEILGADDPYFAPQGPAAFIRGFIEYPAVRQLYDTVQIVYADMADIQAEFEQAFRYFKYYFPEERSPSVATFLSEYSVGAFVYGDNDLAVGLDFFLGEDYPYQQYNPTNPNFSAYLTRTFNRSHLVSKALQPLLEDLAGRPAGNRLLDLMIYNGKKLYVLDYLLPLAPDSVKLEMTPAQVKWLKENEREMWAFFIKEELLYSSETKKIRKYVEYSPHSPNMPTEAPGRTANWLGWQIVKAYMQRFPETSFTELFALSDAQAILDASNYKPRR